MRKLLLLALFLVRSIYIEEIDTFNYVNNEINIFESIPEIPKKEVVLATYNGIITAYGPDCYGCIGYTASGFDVRNNIYYNDSTYGTVRIVAADKSLSFGTIVRITNIDEPIIAIVLDRGGAIGFNKKVYFDLLYPSERDTYSFGKKNATFEILRYGF